MLLKHPIKRDIFVYYLLLMTNSEENYIKAIYHLSHISQKGVNTNAIAGVMETKASSVTDMVKKLSEKELVAYKKYQGVTLSEKGTLLAKKIIRRQRLWEVFLVEKLNFSWDEVHEIAEDLEHIKSDQLISKLDIFLNFPEFDPHGDPIPNEKGEIKKLNKKILSEMEVGIVCKCVGVKDTSAEFLQYLDKQNITLGATLTIKEKASFDDLMVVEVENKKITISNKIASNLFVQ